ncbi:hypothetical protein CROQUDRAFT_660224 [Cronartium quercuum f. sp. fusiforme G11]|uniref:mitogen-activated protein kinase kinase n=1 Tax=Cronartium quercuum f. sp. fusiforme G11 TaxID=708437 RepID=A0A9P6TB48_9BASI|nr:hypothetical protein CROQUDRAFT_660224 [Cronartium quercuum f. sp. fusiforme G11]
MLGPAKKNRNKKGLALGAGASAITGTPKSDKSHSRTTTSSSTKSNLLGADSSSISSNSTSAASASSPLSRHGQPASANRMDYHNKLSEQLATLEIGLEFKLDLHAEDIQLLGDLGAGNGGTVCKAIHVPTKLIMARKLVHIDAKPSVRRQILRELQIMHDCRSPFIVSFYGAYLQDPHICMCMEHMDKGSLDNIYKKTGPIPEPVLGKITVAVVSGLTYLYDSHRIIHRDVKPSNVLFNSQGQIKICDFGVSGELINSIADTFVGTSTYMSPERIQGAQYTVKSDVWSLGITLIELALGRFPFSEDEGDRSDRSSGEELTLSPARPNSTHALETALERRKEKKKPRGVSLAGGGAQMSILELLQHVVNEPAPKLPADHFSKHTCDFLDACLLKDHDSRPTPKQLTTFDWFLKAQADDVNLVQWASTL